MQYETPNSLAHSKIGCHAVESSCILRANRRAGVVNSNSERNRNFMAAMKIVCSKIWMLVAMTVFLIFHFGNQNRAQAFQTEPQPAPASSDLIHSVKGADLFSAYCASCHGTSGVGNG